MPSGLFPRTFHRQKLDRQAKNEFYTPRMSLKIHKCKPSRLDNTMNAMTIALSGKLLLAGMLVCGVAGLPLKAQAAPKKVLVVTITTGFRHSSIPTAEKVLAALGQDSGAFSVEYARVEPNDPQFKGDNGKPDKAKVDAAIKAVLAEKMSPAALKEYDAIIFANTTGDLPLPDKQAFLDWIKSGKGFVGMHSATDTFHHFEPYIEMIGAEFKTGRGGRAQPGPGMPRLPPVAGGLEGLRRNLPVQEFRSHEGAWAADARQASQRQDAWRLSDRVVQGVWARPGILYIAGPSRGCVGPQLEGPQELEGSSRGVPGAYSGRDQVGAGARKG